MKLRFLQELTHGGFGKISLFYEETNNRKVIEKSLLNRSPENCQRLIREGRILIELKNEPNIVDLLGYDFTPNNPRLILPFYEQGTLQSQIGKTSWYDAICIVQNIAAALRAVHRLGGIHRDVKPANVFTVFIPEGRIIKLGDFGFGRIPQPFTANDITRHAYGTPGYIDPALFRQGAKFNQACDIYSLGITGIELITGSKNPASIINAPIIGEAKSLLLKMVDVNQRQRPSAQFIVDEARRIVETYKKNFNTAIVAGGIGLLLLAIFKGSKA